MISEEHKKISNILPISSLVFLLVLVIALMTMNKPEYKFALTPDQTHELVMDQENILVSAIDFTNIEQTNDSLYRFIDLRSPAEYHKSHIEGALNIPLHRILEKEFQDIMNQDKVINVFYTDNQCDACGPWLILSQLGYKNNKILQGGYSMVKANILDKFAPLSGNFRNEKAKYDYNEVISRTAGNAVSASSTTTEAVKVVVPIKKTHQAEEEGGC